MSRRREREDYAPVEEEDSRDIGSRLDKAAEDLDEVQRQIDEAKESAEEIEETKRQIEQKKTAIVEVKTQIEEQREEVERKAEATRTAGAQSREREKTVRATVEEITVKQRRIEKVKASIPPPDVIDKVGAGFGALEKPFADVSSGLRRKAEEVRGRGDRDFDPSERYTSAARARRSPEAIREGLGLTLRAGASAFDAFTMPVRPVLLGETVVTTAKIVVDPTTRKAFLRSAADDPAGFGADILGGAVGGYALGYGVGRVRRAYTTRKYALDVPDEAFLVPEESMYAYPEPVDVTRVAHVEEYMTKVTESGVVDDFTRWEGPITFDKQLRGFRRTGAELLPELVPDQAQSIVYKPGTTTFIETAETFRPAVRVPVSPRITPPGVPLALTTGLGVLTSLRAPKEITRPEEAVVEVVEEARIMTGGSTRVRRRPRPTEAGFIEAPTVIERAKDEEREKDLVAPMFRQRPRPVQRRRPPIPDVVVPRVIEEPRLLMGWPTPPSPRPRVDPIPVYRPIMAKTALKRGRGSWRWFGEHRQYLRGDPLKVLEGL